MSTCAVCGTPLPSEPALRGGDLLHGGAGEFAVCVCPACGAGTTLPPATDEELAAFYPETYGPHSSSSRVVDRLSSTLLRRESRVGAVGALRYEPTGRILDVGCGSGDLGALLIGDGWAVDGVEPSPAAAKRAREQGVDAKVGTIDTVELPPAAYDAIVFHHSLEHVNQPVPALRRAMAALRPGGLLLITVPNFDCWARRRFGADWFHLDVPRHRVHFTPDALRTALHQAGLDAVRTWTSTSSSGLVGSLQYRAMGGLAVREGATREAAGQAVMVALVPAAAVEQRLGGGGDFLHAAARRRVA